MRLRRSSIDILCLLFLSLVSIIVIPFSFLYAKNWNAAKQQEWAAAVKQNNIVTDENILIPSEQPVIQIAGNTTNDDKEVNAPSSSEAEAEESKSVEKEITEFAAEEQGTIDTPAGNTVSQATEIPQKEVVKKSQTDVIPATYGSKYATISCQPANIYANIVWGDDYNIMSRAETVCQCIESSQIGYSGCHLLLSHNYLEFNKLQDVSLGDIFTISTDYGVYQYIVDQIDSGKVTSDETNIVTQDGSMLINLADTEDRLYMYTCYPFDSQTAPTPYRYVVRASRI